MRNPFQYGKVIDKEAFTNRKKDIARLKANFGNGIHTVLISPRRWGKSSLVKVATEGFLTSNKDYRVCYLDLFEVRTEMDFYIKLSKLLLKASGNRLQDWIEASSRYLQALLPKISVSGGEEIPVDFELSFAAPPPNFEASRILNLPEVLAKEKKIKFIICIDEFQNLAEFDNYEAFQKNLRAIWQHHQHVVYCLYGSKRSMMIHLFEDSKMPFYRFGDMFYLEKISNSDWVEYIVGQFAKTGKHITPELASRLADSVENHSYYVQQLAYLVWEQTENNAGERILSENQQELLSRNILLFQQLFESLSKAQINFLRMLADGVKEGFTAQENISKYQMASSANVIKTQQALLKKDIIDKVGSRIDFNDPAFGLWFKGLF